MLIFYRKARVWRLAITGNVWVTSMSQTGAYVLLLQNKRFLRNWSSQMPKSYSYSSSRAVYKEIISSACNMKVLFISQIWVISRLSAQVPTCISSSETRQQGLQFGRKSICMWCIMSDTTEGTIRNRLLKCRLVLTIGVTFAYFHWWCICMRTFCNEVWHFSIYDSCFYHNS